MPPLSVPDSLLLPPTPQNIARAAQLLNEGRLVILPTETVYGIALNLHSPAARAAARQLKAAASGSDPNAPPNWVLHLPTPETALAFAPNLPSLGKRLLAKALPGPVAFQLALSPEDLAAAQSKLADAASETLIQNSLTLRVPELTPTQEVLAQVRAPVAIFGAGSSATGSPGIFEPADIPPSLFTDNQIAAALDAGPTRYRRPSTLVSIDAAGNYAVTRPGVIDDRIIHKLADFVLLFVCSGNTCRSPMAAALATQLLAQKLGVPPSQLSAKHVVVQSAGVHATRGLRAAREAVEAVKTLGADLAAHVSQPATIDLLRRADVIYTMTDAHREEVLDAFPAAARKTLRLDPEGDVQDPIGSGLATYRQVAQHLKGLLDNRLRELPL